jgi:DNA-binding response OmpR family regulator
MSKPVVLLAERNQELRRHLFTQLLRQGYEVIDAPTMVDVLRVLRRHREVDLFILNVSLDTPGDGVGLARLLRQSEHRPRVILLAENTPQCWAADVQELGATVCLAQPFSCADVVACVSQICTSSPPNLSTVNLMALGLSESSLN